MPQKFILIAVTGYLLFAWMAATLASMASPDSTPTAPNRRRRAIVLCLWLAPLMFVGSAFIEMLVSSELLLVSLVSPSATVFGMVVVAVAITLLSYRAGLSGWWSPLPLLRGVTVIAFFAAWQSAIQGAHTMALPDWRFLGISLVLWLVCLILADLALFASHRRAQDQSTKMIKEWLRLCAALPALLIFLIGFRP
ncbi:MAG: hypothetical protein AAF465_12545 [Pseudomonadota bacterium]